MAPKAKPAIERIEPRIIVRDDGCWEWPGAKSQGYGRIAITDNGVKSWTGVHRVVYEAHVGPIPEGLDLDHLCHDPQTCTPARAYDCPHRACCNPSHLQPATRKDNLRRGGGITAERSRVTHCPSGHPYDDENTMLDKVGRRSCRACTYERNRAYYWTTRERRAEYNKAWRAKRAAMLRDAELAPHRDEDVA